MKNHQHTQQPMNCAWIEMPAISERKYRLNKTLYSDGNDWFDIIIWNKLKCTTQEDNCSLFIYPKIEQHMTKYLHINICNIIFVLRLSRHILYLRSFIIIHLILTLFSVFIELIVGRQNRCTRTRESSQKWSHYLLLLLPLLFIS